MSMARPSRVARSSSTITTRIRSLVGCSSFSWAIQTPLLRAHPQDTLHSPSFRAGQPSGLSEGPDLQRSIHNAELTQPYLETMVRCYPRVAYLIRGGYGIFMPGPFM